jgi:radical SAM protein with 4Fe4S-binding SPASM domain
MELKAQGISVGWGFPGCNMKCKHCYNASGFSILQHDLDTLEKIADKIAPYANAFNYGTGEFICNPNTLLLAEYIRENYPHIKQAVTSNGFTARFINPDLLKYLFHDIDFSLDFPNPEEHNAFRGHRLAWKWIIDALGICRNEGIPTSIVTCLTAKTKDDDIRKLLEMAREYGTSWRINWFRPTGRGKTCDELRLDPRRVWEVLKLLTEITTIESLSDPLFDAVLETGYSGYKGCACGISSCRIQTSLEVTPCVFLGGNEWSGGSIKDISLPEIFSSQVFENFRKRSPGYCQTCPYLANCQGGCISRAVLYNGDKSYPDGFCPFYANIGSNLVNYVKENIRIKKSEGSKVHDGYLCTLIVNPK